MKLLMAWLMQNYIYGLVGPRVFSWVLFQGFNRPLGYNKIQFFVNPVSLSATKFQIIWRLSFKFDGIFHVPILKDASK